MLSGQRPTDSSSIEHIFLNNNFFKATSLNWMQVTQLNLAINDLIANKQTQFSFSQLSLTPAEARKLLETNYTYQTTSWFGMRTTTISMNYFSWLIQYFGPEDFKWAIALYTKQEIAERFVAPPSTASVKDVNPPESTSLLHTAARRTTKNADFLSCLMQKTGLVYFIKALQEKDESGRTVVEVAHADCQPYLQFLAKAQTIYTGLLAQDGTVLKFLNKLLKKLNEWHENKAHPLVQIIHEETGRLLEVLLKNLFNESNGFSKGSDIQPNLELALQLYEIAKKYFAEVKFSYANYLAQFQDPASLFLAANLYLKLHTREQIAVDPSIFEDLKNKLNHTQFAEGMNKLLDKMRAFENAQQSWKLYAIAQEEYNQAQTNDARQQKLQALTELLTHAGQKGNAQAYLFLASLLKNHGQYSAALQHYEHAITVGMTCKNVHLLQTNQQAINEAKANLVKTAIILKQMKDKALKRLEKLTGEATVTTQTTSLKQDKGKEKIPDEEPSSIQSTEAPTSMHEQVAEIFMQYYVNADRQLLQQLMDAGFSGEMIDNVLNETDEYLEARAKASAFSHIRLLEVLKNLYSIPEIPKTPVRAFTLLSSQSPSTFNAVFESANMSVSQARIGFWHEQLHHPKLALTAAINSDSSIETKPSPSIGPSGRSS